MRDALRDALRDVVEEAVDEVSRMIMMSSASSLILFGVGWCRGVACRFDIAHNSMCEWK